MSSKITIKDYYRSLTPDDWFKEDEERLIWISVFRIFGIEKGRFNKPAPIWFNDIAVDINYGSIPYLNVGETIIDFKDANETSAKIKGLEEPIVKLDQLREGPIMVIISPFKEFNSAQGEDLQKEKTLKVAGLVAALNSRWLTYKHLFDNTFNIDNGNYYVYSETIRIPTGYKMFDLGGLSLIKLASNSLERLDEPIRERINLALHWYMLSVLDNGIDAFIKCWIALEALAMPDSNVRPINEKLARIYNISYKKAVDRFKIGRIHGLRSDILHNGDRINIDNKLLPYLEAIFVDLLRFELKIDPILYIDRVMSKDDFSFEKIFE